MRIALFSDQHFGPPAYFDGRLRKLSHHAGHLCRELVRRWNEEVRPDLVVNLGDVIEDEDRERDRARYGELMEILRDLDAPVVHVPGNHDTVHLDADDLRALWGVDRDLCWSGDVGELHVVVLHSVETKDRSVNLPEAQLEWLERDLAATARTALVLVHHPLSEQDLRENRWFSRAPHLARVAERRRVREVLARSRKVLAVCNGHVHWNHLDLCEGIPHVTVQSLTENLDEDAPGRPAAAWTLLTLGPGRLVVDAHGEERVRFQMELPRAAPEEP